MKGFTIILQCLNEGKEGVGGVWQEKKLEGLLNPELRLLLPFPVKNSQKILIWKKPSLVRKKKKNQKTGY